MIGVLVTTAILWMILAIVARNRDGETSYSTLFLCLVRSHFHVFRGRFLSTGACHFRHAGHLRFCCLEVLLCRLDAFDHSQRSLYGRNDWVGIFTSVVEELAHELSSAFRP